MSRPWHRWAPSGAVAAIIAGTVLLTSQAGAVDLPDRSAQDVLAMVGHHSVATFSGSFDTSTDLGLPELPGGIVDGGGFGPHGGHRPDGAGPGGDADLRSPGDAAPDAPSSSEGVAAAEVLELLTADHTGRVYVGGADQVRFQLLGDMAEQNLVVSGRDVWHYDSATNTATHATLPDPTDLPHPGPRGHPDAPDVPTPEELVAAIVETLDPSTDITVGQDARVAGRAAYTLVLTPRAAQTLVASVRIAVDGETGFPLGVTVLARGQDEPALRLEYTEIDLTAPDASLFDFTPPAGATVQEHEIPLPDLTELPHDDASGAPGHRSDDLAGPGTLDLPAVLGQGWQAVLDVGTAGDTLAEEPLLAELTEPVDGGRLLSTALLSVLVTDDGRVLAGAVTPEHLQALAAS